MSPSVQLAIVSVAECFQLEVQIPSGSVSKVCIFKPFRGGSLVGPSMITSPNLFFFGLLVYSSMFNYNNDSWKKSEDLMHLMHSLW